MKEIKTTVYSFSELNDAAKEKARDWFRCGNNQEDFDCTLDDSDECVDETIEANDYNFTIDGHVFAGR